MTCVVVAKGCGKVHGRQLFVEPIHDITLNRFVAIKADPFPSVLAVAKAVESSALGYAAIVFPPTRFQGKYFVGDFVQCGIVNWQGFLGYRFP